jgi:Rap/ran-GAP
LLIKKFSRNLIFHVFFFLSFPFFHAHQQQPNQLQGQFTEEQILDNNENSPMFEEFLQLLGDKVRLRGFDKYKGGLGEKRIA